MNSTPSVTSSSSEKSNALPSNLTQSSTISYSSVKFIDEFSDNDYDDSEEEFDVDYLCPECSRPRTNDRWCNFCESKKFSMNFDKWTSGNSYLDKIIRDTQLNATNKCDYLVWINYNEFEDVEYLAKGGYGEVYYGVWVYGPDKVLIYEEENCKWRKEAKTPVALKCLHNSKNITADFLDEVFNLYYHFKDVLSMSQWSSTSLLWNNSAQRIKQLHDGNGNRPDILEIRLLLNKRYWECLESDEYAINLPQNKGNARERRIIKSHPKAVYTSRLLPKPLNDKEYSGYGNFAISESDFIKGIGRTIGQLQQLKIITDENSEDSDYVTRAFEQSLSIGNNISNTSKRAKITNTSKAL
ncbi:4017_t:CDS:2 [Cetraspora pellucida]|uniref:4017_t:CDS:1 n=1 Tax=Cetraspora pellucida TaxID=1433469 RepID=A0A9N9E1D2_9GLOM|nr:4017_t:CDS:2 [Cetraspora pellucida]